MNAMRVMMGRLKLTVNEGSLVLCRVPDSGFTFLGCTFGRCYSEKSGRTYIGTRPAKKSIGKVRRAISELTSRRRLLIDTQDQVAELNRLLTGWANYFCLGPVSKAYRGIDAHVVMRLRRWLCRKHRTPGRGTAGFTLEHLYKTWGSSVLG